MHTVVEHAAPQPAPHAEKQVSDARLDEKKRYAMHIGAFVANAVRGEKLSYKCLLNKRSRACLALYTAIDIAHRVLRNEQAGTHNSTQRQEIVQAADQVESDLICMRGYLRPVFLDRRSFDMQFVNAGDLEDEQASSYGQLGGAELHRVISEATFRTEHLLQIFANCSLTWAVMRAVEPEMQKAQNKVLPQHANSLEKSVFIGSIFRMEWKKSVAQMPLHVIAKHIILILNVPASIRMPASQPMASQ
ncbi:hypothetical protein D9O50_04675 [Oxalobacteraceae bacterium CAVE-383]|nr:hypothetical protein D9O50_04675 [Oxalobacteraceae bacterium CAVE-383]